MAHSRITFFTASPLSSFCGAVEAVLKYWKVFIFYSQTGRLTNSVWEGGLGSGGRVTTPPRHILIGWPTMSDWEEWAWGGGEVSKYKNTPFSEPRIFYDNSGLYFGNGCPQRHSINCAVHSYWKALLHTFIQNSANIACGVLGCDCFLLPDPARLHPTGTSLIIRPGEVGAIRPCLATGATLLPLDSNEGHILPVEIAVHGPGSVTVYMPLDF